MKIICVDNERHALEILVRAVKEAEPAAEVQQFTRAADVLEALKNMLIPADVLFLDIEMPGMTGLDLAAAIKTIFHNINIVFVTGYSEYAMEAMKMRPSGYVMKPATKDKILEELDNLRHPPERLRADRNIQVLCFGNFDIMSGGKPVAFLRSKSKELLAYLVDRRGAGVERAEMAAVLWENVPYDRSHQKQLNVIRADLIKSLQDAGALDMLILSRNSLAVNPDAFDCDYYMALAGDMTKLNSFHGEYMAQYSWAEFTTGSLDNMY